MPVQQNDRSVLERLTYPSTHLRIQNSKLNIPKSYSASHSTPPRSPFRGFVRLEEFHKMQPMSAGDNQPANVNIPVSSGKQQKCADTGVYIEVATGKAYFIKKSFKYTADDMADVTSSSFLVNIIGEQQAIPYKFVKNRNDGTNYVCSEIRKDSKKLSQYNINYREFSKGWKGCTPKSDEAREKVYQECFAGKPQLIRDMAKILVGSIMTLDLDCQVDNLVTYVDEQGTIRLAKFDNGWALAGFLKDKNKVIDLFAVKDILGQKATHNDGILGLSPLPANHFGYDYPKILRSPEFLEEIDAAGKNLRKLIESVDSTLNKITKAHTVGDEIASEKLQLKALRDYAKHIGYTDTADKSGTELKDDIARKMKTRFIERFQSLQLIKHLFQVEKLNATLMKKRCEKSNKKEIYRALIKMSPVIAKLINVIQKNFAGQAVKDFMPSFQHTVKTLNTLLQTAKLYQSKSKVKVLDTKWFDFIESLKNGNTTIPGSKLSEKQILQMYDDNKGKKHTQSLDSAGIISRAKTVDLTPMPMLHTWTNYRKCGDIHAVKVQNDEQALEYLKQHMRSASC